MKTKMKSPIKIQVVESEVKFRTIAEQSPNMIFINADGKVVYANKRCEEITGYSLKEFYSPNFNHLTLTAPEYKDLVSNNFRLHAMGKEVEPYEYALITKGGRKLNTILSTKLIDYKGKKAILGTITDITEKKRAEEALLESEKKYRTLFEHIQDAIALLEVVRNKKGVIVDRIIRDANPAFIKMASARKLSDLKDKKITNVFGTRISKETLPFARRAMTEGISQTVNTHHFLNGKHHDYSSIIIPINKDFLLVRTSDITPMMDQDRKKDEFISIASHELKTPLTSLMLYSQILNRKNGNPAKYLPKMHKQIEQLDYLVNELLDVSKAQSNKLQLNKETFRIVDLIKNCIDTISVLSTHHKINFIYTSNFKVFADKSRMEQVIINLLTNAIKYSPEASKITVTVKTTKSDITVKVKDYGIGIEKENIKKVFDRFFRVSTEDAFFVPGFGMGLYISNEIIKQHGGKIWATSRVGNGTTFSFCLPKK